MLILAAHLALGATFGLALPLFEAPDEANHYLFIRHLQIHRTLPVQTLDQAGPRAHHPPLYFVLAALISAWVPNPGGADRVGLAENGDLWFRYGDRANDHKAKFIHSSEERWPYQGQALAVHVIRPLSAIFSTLAVWFTYLGAREWFGSSPPIPLLAAGLVAFNPMVLFMSGVVQNSTAALATAAALLYLLSRWWRQGFTPIGWAWVGIVFSISVLFQISAAALAAPIAVGLVCDAWRTRDLRRIAVGAVAFSLPVALLTGWWFARNQRLYGDWTANSIVAALWADQPIMPAEQVWHLIRTGMVGRFGFGLIIEYADAIYGVVWAAALFAAAGLVRRWWWLHRTGAADRLIVGHHTWLKNGPVLAWMHLSTVASVAFALALYIVLFIRGGHGRYMFTAYPSLAVLLAAGLLAWFSPRWQWPAAWVVVGLNLSLALYGLFGLLIPTYAIPRSPTQAELQQMTPLHANIGDTAQVLGYHLSDDAVRPGDDLAVTLYWQPLSRTDVPYTVFVHLLEPTRGSLAQQDTYPGAGNYATTVWDPGRPFVDTYRLSIPADAPAASGAQIVVGLYERQSGLRLPVTGSDAGPPDQAWVEFGSIAVRP